MQPEHEPCRGTEALRHAAWLAGWRGAWGNRGMEKGAQKIHIQQQKFTKSKHLGPGVEGEIMWSVFKSRHI